MRLLSVVTPLVLAGAVAVGARAQTPDAEDDRGPRFLVALAPSKPPKLLDVARTPVLRQRITLALRGATLADGLAAVSQQAGLRFMYSKDVARLEQRVTLEAKSITVAAALTELLLDANVDVVLTGTGQAVLVQRTDVREVLPAGGTVTGRITDARTGAGLPGVDVLLDHTRWRTATDSGGRYRISDIDAGTYTLVVRRFGYAKQSRRVVVHAEGDDTADVALPPAAVPLDELVTTATGERRRRDLGNAITTIHTDSVLRSAPIRNLTDLLANRVPGLTVQHTSGAPGDPARMRLWGISSVMRGNDPVVVVDGVRVYAAQSDARSGNLTNLVSSEVDGWRKPVAAPSPLDQIDPNIIEKIEVFKGSSAATLYGADAANGVIVITTKRGKPGPTRWNARVELGRTTPAGDYPTGYYPFGHMRSTGFNAHGRLLCPLTAVQCVRDSLVQYQALNDPDMTILGRGHRSLLTLTASGGSQALTYSLTGTYGNETGLLQLPQFEIDRFRTNFNREPPGWMRQPHHYQTWSVASNVTALLGHTADVSLLTTLSRSEQQRTALEDQQAAIANVYVDKVSGEYFRHDDLGVPYPFLSPATDVLRNYYLRSTASTITLTTDLTANWRPRPWFTGVGRAGLNVVPRADDQLLPSGVIAPNDSGYVARGTGRSLVSTLDLQGTLRRPLKWGFVFETNVGANVVTSNTSDLATSASGLVPGTSSLSGARRFTGTDLQVSTSVFGWHIEPRITGQRLSLSTGLRLDGGSAYGARITGFGSGPGRGFLRGLLALPKLGGSWVISDEPWFPFRSFVSSLQLRGAYGQAQVQPGAMDRLRLYARRINGTGDLLELDQLGNADIRPERSTTFEGGFVADLLDSRVSIDLAAHHKLQVDALMPVTLPISVHGGGTIIQNIGNIRNTGLDVTTRLTPVRSPWLTWSAELNYSHNTNILTKLGNGVEANPRQGIVAGYPVGGRFARPILGYADQNDDGVIETGEVQVGDSLVFMGRLLPAYTTSLFTNLSLFGGVIGITAGFSYDAGQTQINSTLKGNWTQNPAIIEANTPLSQQAAVVVYDSTDYGVTEDIATFRFNSLSVNYRAPARLTRWLGAEELSVAVQGDNLGLHTTYRGKDPDVTEWSPTETIVDTGQLARPRTWQLAVSLRF